MKAMVLAAGFGLRMRPLTLLRAKPALPVLNRPLLQRTLAQLLRAGIRDVVVNLHHLPDSIVSAIGDGRRFGVRVRYAREREILGTGGGPRALRELFGTQPLLLVNGDVLFDFDLRALVAAHRASGAAATLVLRQDPRRQYSAVVSDRRGRILSIAGRPAPAVGTRSLFASVHVLAPELLERLPEGPCDSVRDLYVPLLAEGAALHGVRLRGAWYDLGRPSLYRDAQLRLLPGGRPLVAAGAKVSRRARLRRSVVGEGARVGAFARVERSVLWGGAVVEPGALALGSILTDGAVVRGGERAERVIVLPAAALAATSDTGAPVTRHGDMAWVGIL